MPLTSNQKGAITFGASIVGLALFCAVTNSDTDAPTSHEPTAAPETDEQVLFKQPKSLGKYAAAEIVKSRALAPSQAEIVEKTLVDSKDNYALAYVVMDAPNAFGVKLRKGYCVVVRFAPPRGNGYGWDPNFGVIECAGPPDAATAHALKMANHWPGIADVPMPEGLRDRPRKRR